jgi:hypothetical protein
LISSTTLEAAQVGECSKPEVAVLEQFFAGDD